MTKYYVETNVILLLVFPKSLSIGKVRICNQVIQILFHELINSVYIDNHCIFIFVQFRDEENQKTVSYCEDENTFKNPLNLKTNAGEYGSFGAGDDNDTSDNDDIDEDDDSVNDQDNQIENTEDIVANDNSFHQSNNGNTIKRELARNQLKPEWSPGRQRISGASYHGRNLSSNNSDDFQINEGSYRSTNMDEPLLTKRPQKVSPK